MSYTSIEISSPDLGLNPTLNEPLFGLGYTCKSSISNSETLKACSVQISIDQAFN